LPPSASCCSLWRRWLPSPLREPVMDKSTRISTASSCARTWPRQPAIGFRGPHSLPSMATTG
jgi:hypothetical protein